MHVESLAKVYGAALFEAALEADELDAVYEGSLLLGEAVELEPGFQAILRRFIETPNIESGEKLKALERAIRGRLPDSLVNTVLLMIRKGRRFSVAPALAEFRKLRDRHIRLVQVEATTAVPLGEGARDSLVRVLEEKVGRRVELHNVVKPEILGGLVVRYEGMVADGSLRAALDAVGRGMRAIKFGSRMAHED